MSHQKKPALAFIFITILLDIIGFGIIIPSIPHFISELTGSNLSNASLIAGWLIFSFSIMQFLFSPVLGNLSDRYGRRPVLLISLFGFFINYLIMGFAPTIQWLFAGRFLAGICGASMTTATAYIADVSTPEKRAQNFGLVGAAFGLGFIIGPVLGGILGHFGHRIPFFVAAGLTLLNFLYGFFFIPESLPKENRRKFDIKRANPIGSLLLLRKYPLIASLMLGIVFIYLANHAQNSTWTFFTMEVFKWNEAMVGISLGVIGLMVSIVQGWLIRIINPKLGVKRSIFLGLGFMVLGYGLIAFASQEWMLFVFLVPFCLGGIAGPALQGVISNQVPNNEQGELQGALTSLMSLTSIFGPLIMTSLFSFFTGKHSSVYFPGAPFLMGAILTLICVLIIYRTFTKHHELVHSTHAEQLLKKEKQMAEEEALV